MEDILEYVKTHHAKDISYIAILPTVPIMLKLGLRCNQSYLIDSIITCIQGVSGTNSAERGWVSNSHVGSAPNSAWPSGGGPPIPGPSSSPRGWGSTAGAFQQCHISNTLPKLKKKNFQIVKFKNLLNIKLF